MVDRIAKEMEKEDLEGTPQVKRINRDLLGGGGGGLQESFPLSGASPGSGADSYDLPLKRKTVE